MSVQCPSYISARSAEVILSDVRPIKLKPDALHSINVLLDEILYGILTAARSLATDRLKAALLKVLPTSLGKEALLEAEVELKAYWDRTGTARTSSSARGTDADFDLQWSFELLRLKCEAYSTMNDSDEDAEAEKRLQLRMEAAGSSSPPSPTLLPPAALYLTAILEAICEHVLSNVSRVAARDSSRTLATVQDLFIALGEDDAIFGMFKVMKVYEHIEALSRAHRPRRSKSFSRSTDKIAVPRTSTSSPLGGESTTAPAAKSRMSTDSNKSTPGMTSDSRRTSLEKGKGTKIFHARSLSDKHEPASAALVRSQSENGITREYPEFEEDEELQQEFDELMRSGATMKVSLTPDRLKSMEVYKQERTERERMNRRAAQSERAQDGGISANTAINPSPLPSEPKRGPITNGRPTPRHVDSIVEDDEESSSSNHASSPPLQSNAAVRARNMSLTASSASAARANEQRLRSISISNVPHPRHEDGIARKSSSSRSNGLGARVGSQNSAPSMPPPAGVPKRTRKVQKNRESLDLDEVMAGSDGENNVVETPTSARKASIPPPASEPASPKPHVSRAAQDLIAFLDAGPPEDPAYNPAMNASVISFESSKTRSGRLQRMMSRLTLGGSRESLNGSILEDPPKTPRSLSRKPSKVITAASPPPSFKGVSSKRSIPNVSGFANATHPYPNVVVATPPPRIPLQVAASYSASTTSSTQNSSEDVSSVTSPSLSRRGTATRKAVPPLEDNVFSPSSSIATESIAEGKPLVNGHRHARPTPEGGSSSREGTPVSSPVAQKRMALKGYAHPVKLDMTEGSLHPRGGAGTSSLVSPDRKSSHHTKSESGYASRSASRSPVTPLEPSPPPAPAPALAISTEDAEELRRLMTVATSAEECRLLMDLFLVRNGVPIKDPLPMPMPVEAPPLPLPLTPTLTAAKSVLEDALVLAAKNKDEVERGESGTSMGTGTGTAETSTETSSSSSGRSSPHSSTTPSTSVESGSSQTLKPPSSSSRLSLSVDRRLSVTVPRMSVDHHILNLYRIYQSGLGLDSS